MSKLFCRGKIYVIYDNSKIIKTRQSGELFKRKEFVKKSVIKRAELSKAKYVQKKFKSDND